MKKVLFLSLALLVAGVTYANKKDSKKKEANKTEAHCADKSISHCSGGSHSESKSEANVDKETAAKSVVVVKNLHQQPSLLVAKRRASTAAPKTQNGAAKSK
jgi:hypothetical protein